MQILFPILILVPGLLIPLYIMSRMRSVLSDSGRDAAEKGFARVTMFVMLLLMGVSAYATIAIYWSLSAIGS